MLLLVSRLELGGTLGSEQCVINTAVFPTTCPPRERAAFPRVKCNPADRHEERESTTWHKLTRPSRSGHSGIEQHASTAA
eukprot:scaffold198746_cov35-Tisochrysis_lutea.AAC.2